eukprot:CAMPEP_0170193172 /NCGR_PEP_ID=MMETSP0040_2-20121228/56299_1 /TAXON_ID=641309 /ORGANISM="Lotharella oceanica, Strain CCMP622" /LENGTH=59 /DNA_ID=CAMNT_0010441745 /DNA_START=161 /DNA_END=336 /DNA_ORIENTATION=+
MADHASQRTWPVVASRQCLPTATRWRPAAQAVVPSLLQPPRSQQLRAPAGARSVAALAS